MIRPESEFNIRMAIGSSLTLLTLLTIGTQGDNGVFVRVESPQGLGIKVQSVKAADTRYQMPLPSLWELRNHLKSQSPISPQELKIVIGTQPEARPQYVSAPTTKELGGSLSTRLSARLLNVGQYQPKSPMWIIRVPPRQSPLYLVLAPQTQNQAQYNISKLLADCQKSKSQNLGEDRFIQSLYNISTIESEIQTIAAQIRDLKSASQTILNIAVDSSAQFREDKSLLQFLLQSLTKNSSAQAYSSESQFQLQDQTVNSLDPSHNVPSYSQYQNQTAYNLVQSNDSPPQSQLRNQTVNTLEESQPEVSQSGSYSQFQNQTVLSLVQSNVSLSQSQITNQTVHHLFQSNDSLSQSQLGNQTVKSLEESQPVLSQPGSQSQFQNQTVLNLVQSQVSLSQSQIKNQSEHNLVQSNDSLSQSQLRNQTVNSLDESQPVFSQPGSQSQFQNQTVLNLVQSHVLLSQSQNQTVHHLFQSNDSLSQSQLQNQTVKSLEESQPVLFQSGSQSQFQNQTVVNLVQSQVSLSQSQIKNQSEHNLVQSNDSLQESQLQNQNSNVTTQTGSQSDLQNQSTHSSVQVQSLDTPSQSQLHNQSRMITINGSIQISTSIKYVVERPPPFFTLSDIKDDSDLQTFSLIEKYGYPSETRYVYTEDGYKLCIHRIPRPGAPAVLLVHGLMSSSVSWVQFGPSNGLAYLLYRKGYDVWMLNTRGNIYSREHQKKNLKPRDYWDFSFHEIGKFDLPATIDLILKITRQPKIQYIGHSQGSTVFFVMCSERPEYASKVNLMQALGPTVYLQGALSPVLKFLGMFRGKFSMLVNLLGGYEISSKTRLIKQFRDHICTTSELASRICTIFDFVLCGFDWRGFNETLTPIVVAHASQGASAKQIYHYAQMQGKLNFQYFDHGRILNRIRYDDNEPPRYNLSLATSKVVIHHSAGDWLGVDSDVGHLQKRLPNVVESRKVQVKGFAHFDFTISKDVRTLVYDSVLGHLENNRLTEQ